MKTPTRLAAVTFATLAALALAGPVMAADGDKPRMMHDRAGMMGGDPAMMEMMQHRYRMADPDMAPMMGMGTGMGPQTMHDLGLSRAQVRNIIQIRQESAGEGARLMAEIQERHWELTRAMAADDPDAERIGQLHLQIRERQQELARTQQQTHDRVMETLSDEQRERLQERDRWNRWDWPVEDE
ncbi:Heavy-metal resistance [Thiohalospira halophila DSM 15071]|uniref:Signaling pathway modulator ZraP n=1 Tax=Thiohalospira halophila DSM 15071 TaxID=1123397 RepID=A0A1I1VND6_9GAMM|nr:Spy/CpxP family protein refolding chaperone [Thiohalospira halophila]SFD84324.1 Heavy-metal resistance [Thiohalospira halophila DSM 15071]